MEMEGNKEEDAPVQKSSVTFASNPPIKRKKTEVLFKNEVDVREVESESGEPNNLKITQKVKNRKFTIKTGDGNQGRRKSTFKFKSRKVSKHEAVLLAYLKFQNPTEKWLSFVVPRDKEAWLEYLLHLMKRKMKMGVTYLSDKELKKVITRARPNLGRKPYIYTRDPDTPDCFEWTEQQVASWIEASGYPHLKDAFLINYITGRRLITVDASALSKMGLKDFNEITAVTKLIRSLLGLHRTNILRAIMRQAPYELYLKKRYKNGRTYDMLSFKSFCEEFGYPYKVIRNNRNALIPCTVGVIITPVGLDTDQHEGSEGSDATSETASLNNAPSVEFVVRHQIVRNKTISAMIKAMVNCVFNPACHRRIGLRDSMNDVLEGAFFDLGFGDPSLYTKERMEFATEIAQALIAEMQRTAEVLRDINRLKVHIRDDMTEAEINALRDVTEGFIEEVAPLAALLAMQEFSLESIFKQQPEFEEFIDGIIVEAETTTNTLFPEANAFVNEILSEARIRVLASEHFPNLDLETVRSAQDLALHILDDLMNNAEQMIREAYPDYDYDPGWDDFGDEPRTISSPASAVEGSTGKGRRPNMYIQGGKLIQAPKDVVGLVGADGVVRDVEDGAILAVVGADGYVLGPRNEKYGLVGKKENCSGMKRQPTQSPRLSTKRVLTQIGSQEDVDQEEEIEFEAVPREHTEIVRSPPPLGRKLSNETLLALQDLTRAAVNRAILELFKEGSVREFVSSDGKSVIGFVQKDGRVLDEEGTTLAFLQTDGRLAAADGSQFKTPGILLDTQMEVVGTVSQGQIKLPESVALQKIETEEARRTWHTIKTGLPKQLIAQNGNVFHIGTDGTIKNSRGGMIGNLLENGKISLESGKELPPGIVLVDANNHVIGKVEDSQLKVMVKNQFDKARRVLDTLKNIKGGDGKQENKLVFAEDGKTFLATLTPAGTMINAKNEAVGQLQLDGTFVGPDSKPLSRRVVILNHARDLIAKVNPRGAVELVEESSANFEPVDWDQMKRLLESVKAGHQMRLVSDDRHFLAHISVNSTLLSEEEEVVGRIEGSKLLQNDGTPYDGFILGSMNQVVANVENGVLKVPRKYSMDIYTKLAELFKNPETRKLYSRTDQVIGEITPDLKLVNRGQEIARLLPDGFFMQSKDRKLFRQPGTIRGVDNRTLATIDEFGQILIPAELSFQKVKAREVDNLLEGIKETHMPIQIMNANQTKIVGTVNPYGSIMSEGVAIGKLLPSGVLQMTADDERKYPFGVTLVRDSKVIGRAQPNQEIKLKRDIEKVDETAKARIGNAFRFISEDGKKLVGEITPSLQLINKGRPIAEVHPTENKFVQPNEKALCIPGILLRSDGRVVGRVTNTGEIVMGSAEVNLGKVRQAEIDDVIKSVTTGEKKSLVSKEGRVLAVIELDGALVDPVDKTSVVGQVGPDGVVYRPDGTFFSTAVIVNEKGKLIGRVKEKGAIKLLSKQEQDKVSLAKFQMELQTGDSHKEIFTENGKHLIGVLHPEGHVMKHGIIVAELHPDMTLIKPDGGHLGVMNARDDGKLIVTPDKAVEVKLKDEPKAVAPKPLFIDARQKAEEAKEKAKETRQFWEIVKRTGQVRFISDSLNQYYGDIKLSGDLVHNHHVVGKLSPDQKLFQSDGRPFKGGFIASNDGQLLAQIDTHGELSLLSKQSLSAIKAEKIKSTLLKFGGQQVVGDDGQKIGELTHDGNLVHEKQVVGQLDTATSRFVQPDGSTFEKSGVLKAPNEGTVLGRIDKGELNLVLPAVQKVQAEELQNVMDAILSSKPKQVMDETGHELIGNLVGRKLLAIDGTLLGRVLSTGRIVDEETGRPISRGLIFVGEEHNHKLLGQIVDKGQIRLMTMKDYEQNKADEVWDSVRAGEAQRIFSIDRKDLLAEITTEGSVLNTDKFLIGNLKHNAQILLNNNSPMAPGLVLRGDGAVIGTIGEKGKVKLRDVSEYEAIGTILNTGQIMTTTGHIVGQIVSDGRVYQDGKVVAFFSPDHELLTPQGVAFAKASPSGTLYRLDIIRQADYVPVPVPLLQETRDKGKRGVRFQSAEENPLETELMESAKKQPMVSKHGMYHHRFDKIVTSDGKLNKTMAEKEAERLRLKRAEAEYMKHNEDEQKAILARQAAAAASSPGRRKTAVDLLQQIEKKRASALENEAEKVKRMAISRSMHRRELIEQWAQAHPDDNKDEIVLDIPDDATDDDRQRIVRMTADSIVGDILQMALTNVLFQAEAGQNVAKSLAALQSIQIRPGTVAPSDAQIMWTPHLPSSYASQSGYGTAKAVAHDQVVDALQVLALDQRGPAMDYKSAPQPQKTNLSKENTSAKLRAYRASEASVIKKSEVAALNLKKPEASALKKPEALARKKSEVVLKKPEVELIFQQPNPTVQPSVSNQQQAMPSTSHHHHHSHHHGHHSHHHEHHEHHEHRGSTVP